MNLSCFLLFLTMILGGSEIGCTQEEALRTWTATDGRTLEASMVKGSETAFTIRMAGGQQFELPLEKLSESDRDFVAKTLLGSRRG